MMPHQMQNSSTAIQSDTAANIHPQANLQAIAVIKVFAFGLITGILLFKLDFGLSTKVIEKNSPEHFINGPGDNTEYNHPVSPLTATPPVARISTDDATSAALQTRNTSPVIAPDRDVTLLIERVNTLEQRLRDQDRHADSARTADTQMTSALREQLAQITGKRQEDQQIIADLHRLNKQLQEGIQHARQENTPGDKSGQTSASVTPMPPPPAPPTGIKANPLQDGKDAYTTGNYAVAVTTLEPLANQGNATAQYLLGLMYRNGQGVLANNDTARAWMLKSARHGSREAQIELAKFYAEGINGVTDPFLAYAWYLVAGKNGKYDFISARTGLEAKLQKEMLPQAAALAAQLYQEANDISAPAATIVYTSGSTEK